jgi:hypothetical protein
MSTVPPTAEPLPTKELFEQYLHQRASTRWAAFYLVATSGMIMAWSRSPDWAFNFPFELFKSGGSGLTISSGFAPIFGPVIEMVFYYYFFLLNNECLTLGRLLTGRLATSKDGRFLLNPPFLISMKWPVESSITWMVMLGGLVLSIMILGDFLNLTYETNHTVWCLLIPNRMEGVNPMHRGHAVGTMVYGFWHPWLYVMFLLFKIAVVVLVLLDTYDYCLLLAYEEGMPSRLAVWHHDNKTKPAEPRAKRKG